MRKFFLVLALFLFTTSVFAGTCYVKVTWPNGKPHKGIRVVGAVLNGAMTKTVYTDSDGVAVVEWMSDSKLEKVFVDGKESGECKNGSTFYAVVD